MRTLIALARILRASVHVGHGLGIVATRFRWLSPAQRMARVQWWSARFLDLLGLRVVSRGVPRPGAKLLVANHVSWLDILAINALQPARFVSKAEVRGWPVLGWLVSAAGTLYIERGRARDALRVVHRMAAALEAGNTLAIFPEGTTGDGHALLPFHANLLQAAIATQTPVQAVALRYSDRVERVSAAAAYVGDTHLLGSLWSVVCAEQLVVHIDFAPAQATAHADRRALAQLLSASIEASLIA